MCIDIWRSRKEIGKTSELHSTLKFQVRLKAQMKGAALRQLENQLMWISRGFHAVLLHHWRTKAHSAFQEVGELELIALFAQQRHQDVLEVQQGRKMVLPRTICRVVKGWLWHIAGQLLLYWHSNVHQATDSHVHTINAKIHLQLCMRAAVVHCAQHAKRGAFLHCTTRALHRWQLALSRTHFMGAEAALGQRFQEARGSAVRLLCRALQRTVGDTMHTALRAWASSFHQALRYSSLHALGIGLLRQTIGQLAQRDCASCVACWCCKMTSQRMCSNPPLVSRVGALRMLQNVLLQLHRSNIVARLQLWRSCKDNLSAMLEQEFFQERLILAYVEKNAARCKRLAVWQLRGTLSRP